MRRSLLKPSGLLIRHGRTQEGHERQCCRCFGDKEFGINRNNRWYQWPFKTRFIFAKSGSSFTSCRERGMGDASPGPAPSWQPVSTFLPGIGRFVNAASLQDGYDARRKGLLHEHLQREASGLANRRLRPRGWGMQTGRISPVCAKTRACPGARQGIATCQR